jgi:2-methylisocitrate lyase-like PEP mutase family enzyme
VSAGADRLRALHVPGDPLLLPNAWDPGTAKLVQKLGYPVVATSSQAKALSLGYRDGEDMPVDVVFRALAWITESVGVPVTADLESGYGLPMDELAERIGKAGAVGLNLEDTDHANGGLLAGEAHAQRIAALREADPDLVINARMDVHLRALQAGEGTGDLDDGLARARLYREAGADCVFTPAAPEAVIAAYVEAVAIVNILVLPGTPPLSRLRDLGVARVSLGSGGYHAAMDAFTSAVAQYAPLAPE